jgi:glycine cleavage system H protein
MPEDRIFEMGKFPAPLPGGLRYCRNHMWCQPVDGVLRFGFTSYAVRLMKDVYFLDWCVNAGDVLTYKQAIGNIETSKATSDLYAPLAGTLVRFNQDLLKDPSGINVDSYTVGWLFEMTGDAAETLDVDGYFAFLTAGWETTQRLLKGQINA